MSAQSQKRFMGRECKVFAVLPTRPVGLIKLPFRPTGMLYFVLAGIGVMATGCTGGSSGVNDATRQQLEAIEKQLTVADVRAEVAIQAATNNVTEFFESRTAVTRGFAESVLSMSSKWQLIRSKLPFTDKDAHGRFVRREFAARVFDDAELNALLAGTVQYADQAFASIEDETVIRLFADLPDQLNPVRDVRVELDRMILAAENLRQEADQSAGGAVRQEVIAEIGVSAAAELVAAITSELLVSAGILGAGGASAAETFGIGLVVAVAADVAWTHVTDPAGGLSSSINARLRSLSQQLIEGSQEQPGLRQMLQERWASRRNDLRQTLTTHLMPPIGQGSNLGTSRKETTP